MLTAATTSAQSSILLKVNIPFEFSVEGKQLPAGVYTVANGPGGSLLIRSVDCHSFKVFRAIHREASRLEDSSLIFNKYGNEYFLSTVLVRGTDSGYELFKSRSEKDLIAARGALDPGAMRQSKSVVANLKTEKPD
jgi:hypothetical protein